MKRNSILEQMGIQQWRLREPLSGLLQTRVETNTVEVNSEIEFDSTQAPKQAVAAPDSDLEQNQPAVVDADVNVNQAIDHLVSKEVVTKEVVSKEAAPKDQQLVESCDWPTLIELVNDKQHCRSCAPVTPILGDGNITADWMFVFDSPTSRDIEQQVLLTGRVGQLFDAILLALKLDRETVYLSTIFKCPPAENISENAAQCDDLLQQQIKLVDPKVVITFGEFAAKALIKANEGLAELRQQQCLCYGQEIPIVPTYGLMQMLDTPLLKGKVWDDLKRAKLLTDS